MLSVNYNKVEKNKKEKILQAHDPTRGNRLWWLFCLGYWKKDFWFSTTRLKSCSHFALLCHLDKTTLWRGAEPKVGGRWVLITSFELSLPCHLSNSIKMFLSLPVQLCFAQQNSPNSLKYKHIIIKYTCFHVSCFKRIHLKIYYLLIWWVTWVTIYVA